MKGKFDAHVLWPLAKRVQNWIEAQSTARIFTVYVFGQSLLGPVVYFAKLVYTGLLAIWVELHS